MTVKELKRRLHGCGDDWEVFMQTDFSEENYNEETARWLRVIPIEDIRREKTMIESGMDFIQERCVVLEGPQC